MTDVKVPPLRLTSEDGSSRELTPDWSMMISNQITIISQIAAVIENQRRWVSNQEEIVKAMEHMASPERVRSVVEGLAEMVKAVTILSGKMDSAAEQLEAAVGKLSSAFWGLMKVPVATVLVGAASWAFLYEQKISERTWLIMLTVAVFPWLGDSISAIGKIIRGGHGNGGHGNTKR